MRIKFCFLVTLVILWDVIKSCLTLLKFYFWDGMLSSLYYFLIENQFTPTVLCWLWGLISCLQHGLGLSGLKFQCLLSFSPETFLYVIQKSFKQVLTLNLCSWRLCPFDWRILTKSIHLSNLKNELLSVHHDSYFWLFFYYQF